MMGTGRAWAKVCPGCGQRNSVNALWCTGCEQTLSITTMVELESPEPETKGDGEGPPESGTTTMEEHSAGSSADLGIAAPSPPESAEADSETDCRPDGNATTSSAAPHDDAPHDVALIPADLRRGGCLSLWLVAVMVANSVGIILSLLAGTFNLLACGLGLANIVCAAVLWHLVRWGAIGLACSFGLAFILGLVLQDLYTIVGSIVPMILLVVLVQPIWSELE